MNRTPFSEAFDPRDNSLNFLRFLFAALVLVSHTFPIGGFGGDPQIGHLKLGTFAVGCFFAISGYLITRSRERRGALTFAWARACRIFPGLWVCVFVTAFVIAPAIALTNGGWSLAAALRYLPGNLTLTGGSNTVGSVLDGNPLSDAINGSLWTLPYELACYVAVGLVVAIRPLWRHRVLVLAGYLVLMFVASFLLWPDPEATGGLLNLALLAPFFAAGAVLYRFADIVPYSGGWALAAFSCLVLAIASGHAASLASFPVTYLVFWAAVRLPRPFRAFGSKNDISYGMYVYAFPVQQLGASVNLQARGPAVFAIAALAVTAVLALLSWRFVERPVQGLPAPFARPDARLHS